MILFNDLSRINEHALMKGNTIQLHYWFYDKSHIMDAFVHNKCETEFLGVINEIVNVVGLKLKVETQPLENGGLIRWFRFDKIKQDSIKDTVRLAVVVSLTTALLTTPISTVISETTKAFIEKIFEDPEIKALEKEKLKLEIENLKKDLQLKSYELGKNSKIKKRKSNFYEKLDEYKKVKQISFAVTDKEQKILTDFKLINRIQFKEFILTSDQLDPIDDENAIIEIISPVLKKGPYKWSGVYNGESMDFKMKSNEFKTLIQTGKVEFKNGSSIDCFLQTRRKMDNEGNEKIIGHDVIRVNKYFENDKPIETPEGKHHRKKNEANKNQLKLYDHYKDVN